jgi:hypothetical protein
MGLFMTETSRNIVIFGRRFIEVSTTDGISLQMGFDATILIGVLLSFIFIIPIIIVKNKKNGKFSP